MGQHDWRHQEIGLGVTRCPVDAENFQRGGIVPSFTERVLQLGATVSAGDRLAEGLVHVLRESA